MFAKLFKKNASFDPSELTCLPDLEPSAQVALLDQYLLYCKEHEHSADEQSVALALLAPYAAGSANGTDIAGAELEVVKRALSLVGDADSIQPLLDHSSLGDLAAKRICKLLPIDSAHPTNGHERVFQARLQTATAPDIAALSKRVVTAEQAAWLVIRATNETKDDLLNLPVLQGEAGLVTLEKISRSHDKSSNRLARQKLETLRICRQQLNASVEALTEVHASTERELKLEVKDVDSLIVQRKKLNQLHSRQGQLLEDIARAQSELQAAGEPQTPYALQTDPFASIDLSVPDSQDNPYPALTNQLSELRHSIASLAEMSQEASGHYKTTLTSINDAWRRADAVYPPSEAQRNAFESDYRSAADLLQNWDQLMQIPWDKLEHPTSSNATGSTPKAITDWLARACQAEHSVRWPSDLPIPAQLEQLRRDIAKTKAQESDLAARQQALSGELMAVVNTLQGFIDKGEFKRALGGLSKCRNLQKQGAQGGEKILNRISTQLNELSDWQQFAASPKRDALLQAVQALVDTPLNPDSQRDRLKDLRSQWNALGPLAKDQAVLQQRFDESADQAFNVCREHFALQNKERKDNLRARKALCEQLQEYVDSTDWTNADMKAAETIMRQARQEWRKYHPCDRKALKPVEKNFETLQDALYRRVKQDWDANINAKEVLVKQAEALVEQDNSDGIANGAKTLQAQWREIGTTPRGADQKLWRRFRTACDAIFARLDNERDRQRSEQQQLIQALIGDINSFEPEKLAIAEAESQLAALRDRGRELRLEAKHQSTLKAHERLLADKRTAAQQAMQAERLMEFRAWDEQVSQAEAAGDSIVSPHALFNARVAGTAASEDLAKLTIEAEIAADIPGPEDEQSARMALQIDLMNRGRRNMQLIENQELLERWCRCGPKTADHDSLRQRFFAALTQRLN